jgi:hypothetical protein
MMENVDDDIDAWRRVHRKLTLAVIQSQDNVAAELAKRRYLLEEMNRCKMQNSAAQKSSVPARKKASVVPKKVPPPTIKKETTPVVSTPVRNNWSSEQSMVRGGTEYHTNIPHQQQMSQMMYHHPHPYGVYEGATAMATEEQMSLALLMLQQQNMMQPQMQHQMNQSEDDNDP